MKIVYVKNAILCFIYNYEVSLIFSLECIAKDNNKVDTILSLL